MAAQIFQLFHHDEIADYEDPGVTLAYFIINCDTQVAAENLVESTIAPFIVTSTTELYFNTYKLKAKGPDSWDVEVIYGKYPPGKVGYRTMQADSGGSKIHLLQSIETVNTWAVDENGNLGTNINFEGAIGVNDKEVAGVDVPAQSFEFTMTVIYDETALDPGYLQLLWQLRGGVNNAPYEINHKLQKLSFQAGELRFNDFHATDPGLNLWEIAYKFGASRNVTGNTKTNPNEVPIIIGQLPATGSRPASIVKDGWDYLWIYYVRSTGTRFGKKPVQVNVEQVSPRIDFTQFVNVGSAPPVGAPPAE